MLPYRLCLFGQLLKVFRRQYLNTIIDLLKLFGTDIVLAYECPLLRESDSTD